MIYKTLDTIPYKTFFKINSDPENLLHLISDEEDPDITVLEFHWKNIISEYKLLDPKKEEEKLFLLQREICALECRYHFIEFALMALDFDWNDELIDILQEYGYKIRRENYYADLKRIKRESKGILLKVKHLKIQMPALVESESKPINVDSIFAFYSTILGFDFDYNTVSVTKVFGLQNQVDQKLKAIEKQNSKLKKANHGRR